MVFFFLGPGPLSDEFVSTEILSETPGKSPKKYADDVI